MLKSRLVHIFVNETSNSGQVLFSIQAKASELDQARRVVNATAKGSGQSKEEMAAKRQPKSMNWGELAKINSRFGPMF
jgi:hypothetical protein